MAGQRKNVSSVFHFFGSIFFFVYGRFYFNICPVTIKRYGVGGCLVFFLIVIFLTLEFNLAIPRIFPNVLFSFVVFF